MWFCKTSVNVLFEWLTNCQSFNRNLHLPYGSCGSARNARQEMWKYYSTNDNFNEKNFEMDIDKKAELELNGEKSYMNILEKLTLKTKNKKNQNVKLTITSEYQKPIKIDVEKELMKSNLKIYDLQNHANKEGDLLIVIPKRTMVEYDLLKPNQQNKPAENTYKNKDKIGGTTQIFKKMINEMKSKHTNEEHSNETKHELHKAANIGTKVNKLEKKYTTKIEPKVESSGRNKFYQEKILNTTINFNQHTEKMHESSGTEIKHQLNKTTNTKSKNTDKQTASKSRTENEALSNVKMKQKNKFNEMRANDKLRTTITKVAKENKAQQTLKETELENVSKQDASSKEKLESVIERNEKAIEIKNKKQKIRVLLSMPLEVELDNNDLIKLQTEMRKMHYNYLKQPVNAEQVDAGDKYSLIRNNEKKYEKVQKNVERNYLSTYNSKNMQTKTAKEIYNAEKRIPIVPIRFRNNPTLTAKPIEAGEMSILYKLWLGIKCWWHSHI